MLVGVAVVAIAATDAGYLLLIRGQGGGDPDTPWVVPFVAGYLVLMAVLLGVSLIANPRIRTGLRGAASAGLVLLGLISAFSIGLGVLIAAGLATAAMVLDMRSKSRAVGPAAIGAVAAVVVLLVGFEISWTHIECPRTGESGGSTAGLPSTSYECVQGVLSFP